MRLPILIFCGICLAGPAWAMPLPDCAGEVAVAKAQVKRVENDGTLVLSDGRTAILEGIRLPGADRSDMAVAAEALRVLRQLVERAVGFDGN
jgi:hypothetical protein